MLRMMVAACLCLVALPLSSCATTASSSSKARTALERAELAYARVRGTAEAVLPYLPAPVAARVQAAMLLADAALAVARSDATPDDRLLALHQLAGAVAAIAAAVAAR